MLVLGVFVGAPYIQGALFSDKWAVAGGMIPNWAKSKEVILLYVLNHRYMCIKSTHCLEIT